MFRSSHSMNAVQRSPSATAAGESSRDEPREPRTPRRQRKLKGRRLVAAGSGLDLVNFIEHLLRSLRLFRI
jgi:hypothetical protein